MANVCEKQFALHIAGLPPPAGYWKMEEATGSNREDSIANADLVPSGAASTRVSGKIAFGAFVPGNVPGPSGILGSVFQASLGFNIAVGFTLCGWLQLPVYDGAPNFSKVDLRVTGPGGSLEFIVSAPGVAGVSGSNFGFKFEEFIQAISVETTRDFALATFHFFRVWWDAVDGKLHLQINNGTKLESTGFGIADPMTSGRLTIGAAAQMNQCIIDEVGFWNVILTDEQAGFLYNSGTGRTYPF